MPEPRTWYLAVCLECTPRLSQPFTDEAARDTWAAQHEETAGHGVALVNRYPPRKLHPPQGWTILGRTEPARAGDITYAGGWLFTAPEGTPPDDLTTLIQDLGDQP